MDLNLLNMLNIYHAVTINSAVLSGKIKARVAQTRVIFEDLAVGFSLTIVWQC